LTLAWTDIPDYVIDQFVAESLVSTFLSNQRYVCETLLGIAGDQTGDYAREITFNNGATDGGAVYFEGGTSRYLKCNAAGTELSLYDYKLKLASPYLIYGDRVILQFVMESGLTSGFWISTAHATVSGGYKAHCNGSILSFAAMVYNLSDLTRTIDLQCHINQVEISQVLATMSFTAGAGQQATAYATAARGVDTFLTDDLIDVYCDPGGSSSTTTIVTSVELILDGVGSD
jgi:hypothetical protein